MLDDTLYTCFPHSVIMAIDATTGKTKWRFDPKAERQGNPYLVCRGVAYYEVDDPECPRRIYAPMFDARIVALNADDGRLARGSARTALSTSWKISAVRHPASPSRRHRRSSSTTA
jgi:quinoprotein glucose dehydrogenase